MKRSFTIILALLAAMQSLAALNRIPADPAVRIGTLPNGLTYYIRHNAEPAGLADFFIAQRVGSIQEEDDQQGLAHFLEHMCFNGTEHFPGNSLIDYLESVGVKFGANLNAYTAADETVYNICEVPVGNIATQDSCLLILRDWSHGLLLEDADIDAERGVIVGEWRQRRDAPSARLLEKTAPVIYGGSIYGRRLPIGKMDVVENFSHDTLRDFYHKWYNPENQCIIVVGDIDPEYIEGKITGMFADIPAGENRVERTEIPANDRIIATYRTDPEQPYTAVTLYIKHDGTADAEEGTIAEIRRDLVRRLVSAMLVDRFDQLELDPDVPFTNVGIGDLNFLISRQQQALLVRANAKTGDAAGCIRSFSEELKRAATHGFTQTELDRAKLAHRADLDSEFANRDKTTNTQYARKYVRHYLDGGALPSIDAYYKMMKGVISGTSLDDVNSYIREVVTPYDRNVIIYVYAHGNDDSAISGDILASAYSSVDTASLIPYREKTVDTALMAELPTPGSIIAEEDLTMFGAKMLTLSNGIKVYMKKTDFTPDRISITAYSPGGFSQRYSVDEVPDYLICNDALAISGCNGISSTDLKKMLVGKNVRSAIGIENMEEQLSASASVADIETAMQLLHFKATALTPDSAAFAAMMANQRLKFRNRNTNATVAMGDSIHLNVYNRHPLGAKLTAEDLDKADYSRILDIYRDRFGDMGDFSFFIVGNYDEENIKPLIERYIASLPAAGRKERPRDIGYGYYTGTDRRVFDRQMEMPQSIAYTFLNGECPYSLENVITASTFGRILASRLRKDLREDRGWTYGVKSHCSISAGMNGSDPSRFILPVYVKVIPGTEIETADIVLSTVSKLADPSEIKPEEISPVIQYLEKNHLDNSNDNGYWLLVMHLYDKFGVDMHNGYIDTLHSLTPEKLSGFVREKVIPASRLQLIMKPI